MRKFSAIVCFIFASSFAIGCATSTGAPSAPSGIEGSTALTADQLEGKWTLVSVQRFGQAEQPTPANASYTLTLSADGRLSTLADCNGCIGSFTVAGQTFTVRPALACTRAACPTMEFESIYTSLLSGDSTVALAGQNLLLSSGRGSLRFTR